MADFLDSSASIAAGIVASVSNAATIIKNPSNQEYNAAQQNFGTAGEAGFTKFNIPKMKFSYVVEFVPSEFAKNFIQTQLIDTHYAFDFKNVSCFVKDVTLPSNTFTIEEVNQYNKSRLMTGKVVYKPSTITFFDTIDSSAYLLLDAYRKYYYGDFFDKDAGVFRNDVLSNSTQYEGLAKNWGRSVMNNGDYDSQYFFKQINIYEIDNDPYTCHNMYNVYIEDATLDTKSHDSTGEPSLITMTLRYEGIGNLGPSGFAAIASPTIEIASLLTDTSMFGKSGFFKYYGELDDKTKGLLTVGKIIRAGTAGYDIISSVDDILNGDFNSDTIRNIGSAVTQGANAIGLGSVVSSASGKFGLGNILGDF